MIGIIGGGPVGCYLASLLAKEKDVSLFEEHFDIGRPVQCTGIVTGSINNIIKLKEEFIVNKVNKARITSFNKESVEVNLKTNYILDREKFDKYLFDVAVSEGVKCYLGYKFKSFRRENNKFVLDFENKKSREFEILVGADGPMSSVAKFGGLYCKREFIQGVQARVNLKCDSDLVDFYLGYGEFGWVVPENNKVARVGVVSRRNANECFSKFLGKKKVIEYQGGMIPIYDPSLKIQDNNLYLVGDAATQVKATTYGGLVFGLMGARELNKAVLNNLDYKGLCDKSFGKELSYGLKIRKILNKLSNDDCNYLVKLFKQEKLKRILEEYDRDYPSRFILRMIAKEPRLLKFII